MNERMINMFSAKGETFVKSRAEANKKILRARCRDILNGIDPAYVEESSRKIAEAVLSSEAYRDAETILFYMSFGKEPVTDGMIAEALRAGKRVLIPRCLPDHQMEAKVYDPEGLSAGAYGIREPSPEAKTVPKEEIDLAIIPCLCCDPRGNRLGHGAGYYDRYLAGTDFYKMALCFDKLLMTNVHTYTDDVRMDAVVTESKIYRS